LPAAQPELAVQLVTVGGAEIVMYVPPAHWQVVPMTPLDVQVAEVPHSR